MELLPETRSLLSASSEAFEVCFDEFFNCHNQLNPITGICFDAIGLRTHFLKIYRYSVPQVSKYLETVTSQSFFNSNLNRIATVSNFSGAHLLKMIILNGIHLELIEIRREKYKSRPFTLITLVITVLYGAELVSFVCFFGALLRIFSN